MAKKQISKSGAAKLREELDYLVTVRRAEMAQKLKEARAQGDLSENAEYDEAKNEQAIMEAQIMEIQYTLDNSEIVDDNASIDEVGLGSTIKIKNFRTGKIETLQIVSSNEANFKGRNVTHAARGVAGRVQHRDRHFADLKHFTVFESLVHLAGDGLVHHEKRAVLLIVRCKRRFRLIGAHRHTEHLVQAVSLPNVVKMAVCQQNSLQRIFFNFI